MAQRTGETRDYCGVEVLIEVSTEALRSVAVNVGSNPTL